MKPSIIKGSMFSDNRGALKFNNDFDVTSVKRIYTIENYEGFIRRWQGHKIEQRWFSATSGSFLIKLIKIDHWDFPNPDLPQLSFEINSESLDVLHVPSGYVSSIEALEINAKLLVFADFRLNEITDEYRFPKDYFKIE